MRNRQERKNVRVSPFLEITGGIAERHRRFLKRLGDIETRCWQDKLKAVSIEKPVFISGLARSGTTVLLVMLEEHPETVTHRYRDFPFLEAPLWWNRFYDRASRPGSKPMERFHRDRILVTPESPEALEEIIWMSFFPWLHDPGRANTVDRGTSDPDFACFFTAHIRKLLFLRRGRRYLSKANYNVARLSCLADIFPDARFLVLFRDPRHHIASLMKQHRLFCEEETRDPRVLNYMRRSGHFEFGLDRRPVNMGHGDATERIMRLWAAGRDVEGWARYWSDVYGYVVAKLEQDRRLQSMTQLVSYDDLCISPDKVLERTYRHCDLPVEDTVVREQASRLSAPSYYSWDFSRNDLETIERETSGILEKLKKMSHAQDVLLLHGSNA